MDTLLAYLHTHSAATIAVIVIALVALYFLFKSLIKLALLTVLILIIVGGYFYFSAPKKSPEDIGRALKKAKTSTEAVVEKGKDAYEKGKVVVEKGKEISDGIGKALSGGDEKKQDSRKKRDKDE